MTEQGGPWDDIHKLADRALLSAASLASDIVTLKQNRDEFKEAYARVLKEREMLTEELDEAKLTIHNLQKTILEQ